MKNRLYPVSEEYFDKHISEIITSSFSKAGRPQKITNYQVFCGTLYVLRTGIAWRDLPTCFGYWHSVYLRFKKGSDRGVWWKVLLKLQQDKKATVDVVLVGSTTFKIHRQGGGVKGGFKAKVRV